MPRTKGRLVTHDEKKLGALAEQINSAHNECVQSIKEGLRHAIKAGELLQEAKALCAHGEWGRWLVQNCTVSERTAQAYMRVAREMPRLLESKAQHVADLSFRDALQLLESGGDSGELDKWQTIRKLDAEFDQLCEEGQSALIVRDSLRGNPSVTGQEANALIGILRSWDDRFADFHLRAGQEFGRLFGDLQDGQLAEAVAEQIVLTRRYPVLAEALGLPKWDPGEQQV